MKQSLLIASLFLASMGSVYAADGARIEKPNIVFLFADDLGWADLQCYGHPYAKTPNLDQLARDGTRFLRCYATGVTCCPSRTGFMTSKFPATFAKYPATGGFGERVTITELLKKQGYATGHFGKWHIGPTEQAGTYGIDEINTGEASRSNARSDSTRSKDARVFDNAIRFIEQHKDGPFYINVWSHISHHPVNPSQQLLEAFGPLQVDEARFSSQMQEKFQLCKKRGGDVSDHMRRYLAEIKSLDDEAGRFLKRLDELGLRDNTIVVFSSDQGPAPIFDRVLPQDQPDRQTNDRKKSRSTAEAIDDLRLNAMGYAGPHRGGKTNQHEGGILIPFIVRWPGRVPDGRTDDRSVISGADWLPTLCALTNTKINAADFDGEDASDAWLGGTHTRTKPLLWKTSTARSSGAVRDGKWKLHYPNNKRDQLELFDLVADPGEQHNLVNEHPDITKRLSTLITTWQATLPKEYDKGEDNDN